MKSTTTIAVTNNGRYRSVTVLTSRAIIAEALITIATLAVGFFLGRAF